MPADADNLVAGIVDTDSYAITLNDHRVCPGTSVEKIIPQARTGQGIMGSLMSGAGKGQLGSSAYGAYDTGSIGPSQGQQGISQLMKLFGNSSGGSTGGSSTGGTSSSSSPLNYFQARNQKIQELQKYITGEPPLTGIGNQAAVSQDAEKQALEGSSTDKNKPEYVADSKPVEVFNDETSEG